MVTAILPTMTGNTRGTSSHTVTPTLESSEGIESTDTTSMNSEDTITPENQPGKNTEQSHETGSSPPRLAGLVGLFTGCGALVALLLFLPLPAQFSHLQNVTQAQAVADSFYVVGGIALLVSCSCFFGLRGLQGEGYKGWRLLLGIESGSKDRFDSGIPESEPFLPYWRLLLDSTLLGFKDANIGLGYLGGFVARASSVGRSSIHIASNALELTDTRYIIVHPLVY